MGGHGQPGFRLLNPLPHQSFPAQLSVSPEEFPILTFTFCSRSTMNDFWRKKHDFFCQPGFVSYVLPLHPGLYGVGCLPPLAQPHDGLVQPQHLTPCPRHFHFLKVFRISLKDRCLMLSLNTFSPPNLRPWLLSPLFAQPALDPEEMCFFRFHLLSPIHLLVPVLFIFFPHRPFIELKNNRQLLDFYFPANLCYFEWVLSNCKSLGPIRCNWRHLLLHHQDFQGITASG